MQEKVPDIKRGQMIRASWLTKVGQIASRADSVTAGNNSAGISTSRFTGMRNMQPQRLLMVQLIRDLIPAFDEVGGQIADHLTDEQTFRADGNAQILQWDQSDHEYKPKGGDVVQVYSQGSVPVRAGRKLLVRFDYDSSRWVPTSTPETEIVEVTGVAVDGLYPGKVKILDASLAWVDAVHPITGNAILCWVKDVN